MSNKNNELLTVGIDVGTSTTQLVFSRITFKNQASIFTVPRIDIDNKVIVYQSDIHFTPLLDENMIDFDGIVKIVDLEYQKAGIQKEQVDIGAIIITGESARKRNASDVLTLLSAYAGDFVVASAGVDLESVIAAKGAGADTYSKEHSQCVVHIDIGGGTSNYCVFQDGDVVDTGCFDIGGRLIKLDSQQNVIHMTKKAHMLVDRHGLNIKLNQYVDVKELEKFCDILTRTIESSLFLRPYDEDYELLITHHSIKPLKKIDSISFSGGVAEYVYRPINEQDILKFNDIGLLLAKSIKLSKKLNTIHLCDVLQTVQATVVGAGMHTTKLSGSTILCESNALPLKNVSIIKLSPNEIEDIDNLASIIKEKLTWYDSQGPEQIALAFAGQDYYSYAQISQLAQAIVKGMEAYLKVIPLLIVLIEKDYAKSLGYSLRSLLHSSTELVSLDSIQVSQQDYIDIGKPIVLDQVLPVIIKTIIFN